MSFGDLEAFELAEFIESHEGLASEGGISDFDAYDLSEDEYLEDLLGEEPDAYEEAVMEEAMREALLEDYADATPEELGEALSNVFESLTPAESFNFGKALSQIEKGATRTLSDPTFSQIAKTALPIAGGAAGTFIGGPAGASIGSGLGTAAARALPTSGAAGSPAAGVRTAISQAIPAAASAPSPVAGGSAAAAQALVLTQQPEVLKSLLALAMGQHGRKSVNGVPVGAVMNMLNSVLGQAAADADDLVRASDSPSYLLDGAGNFRVDPAVPSDRAQALYTSLLEAENELLDEGWGRL